MNPKIKLALKILIVILVIVLTSFITKQSAHWFKPQTHVKIVFDDCVFSGMPELRPVKDRTDYYFKGCRLNGQEFGEYIAQSEVDEAIAKLEKEIK